MFSDSLIFFQDHVRGLGDMAMELIETEGGKPITFGTPVVSDGITMGIEVLICLKHCSVSLVDEIFAAK
jgi:dihydroxyacid dehydratase/phosphogluconate dehydratase